LLEVEVAILQLRDQLRDAIGIEFSDREQQVLILVRQRKVNKEIAAELNITLRTVKHHMASLLRKANVKSRHDL